jgi:hypothetical protein
MQVSSFGKALYYPYIQIQDENWLKLALLYFDGIHRIVPKYTDLHDSVIEREVVDRGLLEATSPEDYREAAEEKFKQDFLPLLKQETSEATSALEQASQTFSKNRVSTKLLHIEKMTYNFRLELKSLGLARQDGEWLKVDSNVAGSYMMCLAIEMSNSIKAPPVTDTLEYLDLGEYLSFGKVPRNPSSEPHSILLNVGIDFPDPQSLKEIPISTVLNFHENRQDERRRFRQAVESITAEANKVTNPIALQGFFSEKGREIKSAVEDHQKALDELKIKSIGSLLKISVPTMISALSPALVAPQLAPVLTVGGITWSLIEWWAEIRGQRREKIKSCPWHYLLSMKQVYKPKTSLGVSLWGIRQKAISAGESLLSMNEIEQEVSERRGGYRES